MRALVKLFGLLLILAVVVVLPVYAQCLGLEICMAGCSRDRETRVFLCQQVVSLETCEVIAGGYYSSCLDKCFWHMCGPVPI